MRKWVLPFWWLVLVSLLALFAIGGALFVADLINGRGDPDEAAGLLAIIAAGIGFVCLRIRKRSKAKETLTMAAARERTKPEDNIFPLEAEPMASRSAAGPSIFISYRRSDSGDITGRIYDRLVRHFPRERVFKDVDSIPLGVDFRKHLTNSVGQCQLLLAVVGRSWRSGDRADQARSLDNAPDYVRIELEAAFARKIPIIPLLVQGATMPQEQELPPSLQPFAYQNWISIRPDPDFHQDMTRLIKGIETHLNGVDRGHQWQTTKSVSPA